MGGDGSEKLPIVKEWRLQRTPDMLGMDDPGTGWKGEMSEEACSEKGGCKKIETASTSSR